MEPAKPVLSAARSIPGNRPKKDSSRSSIRCRPSAKPARPSSGARRVKVGVGPTLTMTAASRARAWSGRRSSDCWNISARG